MAPQGSCSVVESTATSTLYKSSRFKTSFQPYTSLRAARVFTSGRSDGHNKFRTYRSQVPRKVNYRLRRRNFTSSKAYIAGRRQHSCVSSQRPSSSHGLAHLAPGAEPTMLQSAEKRFPGDVFLTWPFTMTAFPFIPQVSPQSRLRSLGKSLVVPDAESLLVSHGGLDVPRSIVTGNEQQPSHLCNHLALLQNGVDDNKLISLRSEPLLSYQSGSLRSSPSPSTNSQLLSVRKVPPQHRCPSETASREDTVIARSPYPLAGRPFWLPPSSPGGLRPRCPPSRQPACSTPPRAPNLPSQKGRFADQARSDFHGPRRRLSVLLDKDSELPYRSLDHCTMEADEEHLRASSPVSAAHARCSACFDWQTIPPSSSLTLSEAAYAAKAFRRRQAMTLERITLTDDDIIEADSSVLTVARGLVDIKSQNNSEGGKCAGFDWRQPGEYSLDGPHIDISPLLDTSRTDIEADVTADDEEDAMTAFGEDSTTTGQILRSSYTFGPETLSAFHCAIESEHDGTANASLEVVDVAGFAVTTPSDALFADSLSAAAVYQGRESLLGRPIILVAQDLEKESITPALNASPCNTGAKSVLKTSDSVPLMCGLGIRSLSSTLVSRQVPSIPLSYSHTISSAPVLCSSLSARKSFVPRPLLLALPTYVGPSSRRCSTSKSSSPPGVGPRPLLLSKTSASLGPHRLVHRKTPPILRASSRHRLSISSCSTIGSTSTSRDTPRPLSPPSLSVEDYLQYSPIASPNSGRGIRPEFPKVDSDHHVRARRTPYSRDTRSPGYYHHLHGQVSRSTTTPAASDHTASRVSRRIQYRPSYAIDALNGLSQHSHSFPSAGRGDVGRTAALSPR